MKRLAALATAFALLVLLAAAPASGGPSDGRPNIVNIVTDDQTMTEMVALQQTRALIGGTGMTFRRFYSTYPLCCPARATLLTGRYAHNHGVRGNTPPSGGVLALNDSQTVPVWLRAAGYKTVHVGKYLNGYALSSAPYVPPGWDEWYGKLGRTNGVESENHYFSYTMFEQGASGLPRQVEYGTNPAEYQTDVYRDKAVEAIQRLGGPGTDQPFYISLNFGAPHFPYTPAPRDAGRLKKYRLPKLSGFNERNLSDKPRFMRLGTSNIPKRTRRGIIKRRRERLEQLLSVDAAIKSVWDQLSASGELDNTYIIFSSDNGYFSGEHKVFKGKYLPHEPSSHVPLIIRGPGIPAAGTTRQLVANIDVAPTIVEMAGPAAAAQVPGGFFDGRSMLPFAGSPTATDNRPVLLEGDRGTLEGEEASGDTEGVTASTSTSTSASRLRLSSLRGVSNLEQEPYATTTRRQRRKGGRDHASLANVKAPAYRAIRTDRYLYVGYADGSEELYDLLEDPGQLDSVHRVRRYKGVKLFLAAELKKLENCRGAACGAGIPLDPAPEGTKGKKGKGGKRGGRKGGRKGGKK